MHVAGFLKMCSHNSVTTLALRCIKPVIAALRPIFPAFVVAMLRHTDADCHRRTDVEGMPGDVLSHTLGCLCGGVLIGAAQYGCEFLATHAKHSIFLTQGFP